MLEQEQLNAILTRYKRTGRCNGLIHKNSMLQAYIGQPLLADARKVDFRYYIIATGNGAQFEIVEGFGRTAVEPYDPNSSDVSLQALCDLDQYSVSSKRARAADIQRRHHSAFRQTRHKVQRSDASTEGGGYLFDQRVKGVRCR